MNNGESSSLWVGQPPPQPPTQPYERVRSKREETQHLCIYEPRHLPCNPCKWWNLGTCNKAKCKFCHIPPIARAPKPTRLSAEEEQNSLKEMLAESKYRAYLFYDDLIEKNLVAPAAIVLKDALRKAYIDSFSISQTKPYGAAGEFNPMIQRVKQIIDDIEQFILYAKTPYKQETGDQDRTTRLNSMIWQQELHGKDLHARLVRKLNECDKMEDIKGWLNITKETTQLMAGLKAATRGSAKDMNIEEDDDLHHLQSDLDGLVGKAQTADECLRSFKLEFGEM